VTAYVLALVLVAGWAPPTAVAPAPPQTPAQAPAQSQTPTPPVAPVAGPPPPALVRPTPPALPPDAATALERAKAAYEYGDLDVMVDSARMVAEGYLPPTPLQREQALRYLGIGLYLTNRLQGAETAFFDLLRLRTNAHLDPTTTRPDCVAFFEGVRRRHGAEIREAMRRRPGKKTFALAFLPPLGQFQNGSRTKGIVFAALEAVTLAGAVGTYAQLRAWETPDQTFGSHGDDARKLRVANWISVGAFVLTVAAGVIDGVVNFSDEPDETRTAIRSGRWEGLGFRF
jgi:hypothetical protein